MHPWKLITYGLAGWLPGGRKHCSVCNHGVRGFMPYRRGSRGVAPLMRALDVIGSDVDNFECPRCGAHDRERHLLHYLQASGLSARMPALSILHFAPEKRLARWIAAHEPARHVRCDLHPSAPGIERVDMQAMPFEDASFDLVIANHVLEHVADVGEALAEIHRVLMAGGHAILQTPYSAKLRHTWTDPGIDSPQARLQAFGQEDHVRLFGQDIFDRIVAVGFESRVRAHAELLPHVDPVMAGVNPAEPFFLFRKPATASMHLGDAVPQQQR